MSKKRIRIVNKTRFILSLVFILLFSYLCINIFFNLNVAEGKEVPAYIEVQVRPGDTLWQLAKTFGPEKQDIRYSIYEISSVNQLQTADIYPGQIIKIPIH